MKNREEIYANANNNRSQFHLEKSPLGRKDHKRLSLLFLGMDAILHLTTPAPVVEAFARLGIPLDLSVGIGAIELVCVAIYVIPRTAVLGAILWTGYLGGAIAIHLRSRSSLFEAVFPVIIAVHWSGPACSFERSG